MEWIEVNPLPEECQNCEAEECEACEFAGKRWRLPLKDELRLKQLSLSRAIARLQKQLEEVQEQLRRLEE